jgi:hypothetical protein
VNSKKEPVSEGQLRRLRQLQRLVDDYALPRKVNTASQLSRDQANRLIGRLEQSLIAKDREAGA